MTHLRYVSMCVYSDVVLEGCHRCCLIVLSIEIMREAVLKHVPDKTRDSLAAVDVLYVHAVRDVNVQACAAKIRPVRASSQGQEAPGLLEDTKYVSRTGRQTGSVEWSSRRSRCCQSSGRQCVRRWADLRNAMHAWCQSRGSKTIAHVSLARLCSSGWVWAALCPRRCVKESKAPSRSISNALY